MQKKHLKLKQQAFTLVELIVGLLIGSIFFLTVGVISNIGQSSFENLKKESQTYGDMFNGLELMRNSVHKANLVLKKTWSNPPWIDPVLEVDNSVFGIFQLANSPTADFVRLKDKTDTDPPCTPNNPCDVILYEAKANSLHWTPVINGTLITVPIQGEKGKESFNWTIYMFRRN